MNNKYKKLDEELSLRPLPEKIIKFVSVCLYCFPCLLPFEHLNYLTSKLVYHFPEIELEMNAILLHKIYNDRKLIIEWVDFNFKQILTKW
jgi:hypothetical protein